MIRELWRRLMGVLFPSRTEIPRNIKEESPAGNIQAEKPASPDEKKEAGLSTVALEEKPVPSFEEEEEEDIPANIQGKQPLPPAKENTAEGNSIKILDPATTFTKEHGKWKIQTCKPRRFDKVGRLFIQAGNLIIKIDVFQSYVVPAKDLQRLLNGEIVDIRARGSLNFAGTARPSASGRGVNFRIGERFYTVPYKNFRAVIEGKARKAAVFAGNGRGEE